MNWSALSKRRIDLGLTAAVGFAGAGAGLYASSAVGVVSFSALALGAGLWLAVRGINRDARVGERDAQTHATITYLAKPERERNIEMLSANYFAMQKADGLFRTNFDYSGPSTSTSVACRRCGWKAEGVILADARAEALAHLNEAHDLAA